MRRLLAEPFFGGLVDDGSVVGSRMLEAEHPSARLVMEEGWSAAVEHEVVRFVTWPYEWPFSMLKDAALLQLRILEAGGRNGYLLKDATAFATNHPYNTADLQQKRSFVLRHTAALRPAVTWDLGANTGEFARIAAEHSGLVVAVDSDHDAVDGLYRDLRQSGPQNVIPLVMDVANPSPGQGWAGRERPAFDARRGPDMVLCLALVHHVKVAANIPLRLFVDWLRSLDATCILEFVGRNDEMFQSLLANKQNDYADYSAENFESEVRRCFFVRDRLKLKGGLRELFLLEPAP